MGSLALWRGLEGAGKGMDQVYEQRLQDESHEKRSGIDEARAQRLEKLRQANRIEIQEMGDTAAMERLEKSGEQAVEQIGVRGDEAVELEGVRQEGAMTLAEQNAFNAEQRQIIEQNWRSIENELDRQVTREGNAARAGASTTDNPLAKAYIGRFEKTSMTEQEMNEYGIPMSQRDLPLTYDNMSGKHYAQDGDKLYWANAERPDFTAADYRPPNEHAVNALAQNPTLEEAGFVKQFGYLPSWFLFAKMQEGIRLSTGGTQGAE